LINQYFVIGCPKSNSATIKTQEDISQCSSGSLDFLLIFHLPHHWIEKLAKFSDKAMAVPDQICILAGCQEKKRKAKQSFTFPVILF
jgi:hypothetical protein